MCFRAHAVSPLYCAFTSLNGMAEFEDTQASSRANRTLSTLRAQKPFHSPAITPSVFEARLRHNSPGTRFSFPCVPHHRSRPRGSRTSLHRTWWRRCPSSPSSSTDARLCSRTASRSCPSGYPRWRRWAGFSVGFFFLSCFFLLSSTMAPPDWNHLAFWLPHVEKDGGNVSPFFISTTDPHFCACDLVLSAPSVCAERFVMICRRVCYLQRACAHARSVGYSFADASQPTGIHTHTHTHTHIHRTFARRRG